MFNVQFFLETLKDVFVKGFPLSILVVILTVLISTPIAFLLGLVQARKVPFFSGLITVVTSFFRSTPLMVLIFLCYNALPNTLTTIGKHYVWKINFYRINPIVMATFICSLFTISIMTGIFYYALLSVHKGQLEASYSVGLSSFQAYIHIIIPQALVSAVPNLCNNIVNLYKGTSLLFYMGLPDIMGTAKNAAGISYNYLEAYLDVLIVYVITCYIMQKLFGLLEKRLNKYNQPR